MRFRYRKRWAALIFAGLLVATACGQDASQTDISEPKQRGRATPTDYSAQAPDSITVYYNVDGHPNLVRVCIDGVAFRTVSSSHDHGLDGADERVEEWDAYCKGVDTNPGGPPS